MPKASDSDSDLLRNSKFRAFADALTAALQQFEKAKKWPDLVECMKRVQKVMTKYSGFPAIPIKLAFCKRVAQCLNPNLPSGVHIKTLETLSGVLERIGPGRLSESISIYSMGLFPLFQFAAMTVKPAILQIFETFYLPLGKDLIPCMTGLLISLLPGLEEEGNEIYDRVLSLINKLEKIDRPMFYHSMWKAAVSSPNVRGAAMIYLDRKFPKGGKIDEDYLPERQTLVKSAIMECLADPELLTQRAAMELLLNHFPISSGIFDQWDDIAVLVVKLVLRKEIALNRRLYNWFLGNEPNEFEEHGKKVIIAAVQQIFSSPPDTVENATHPFKIMKSLLEKQEIGEAIIENVLISVFYSLHRFKEGHQYSRELRTQVNSLLDLVQPEIIWEGVISLYTEDKVDALGVIDSLIDVLRCDEETQHLHLPNLLSKLLNGIERIGSKGDLEQMYSCLLLARKVFGKFSGISTNLSESQDLPNENLLKKLEGLYRALLSYQNVVANVYEKYVAPHFSNSSLNQSADTTQNEIRKIGVLSIELLVSLFIYLPNLERGNNDEIPVWLKTLRDCSKSPEPTIACTALRAFVELISVPNSGM